MASDQLFRELTRPEIMKIGWHLAQGDSRDDFVRDPVGYADYHFHLSERLEYLIKHIQSNRYRPRYLIEVDVPKSGLSVRPGNVLPIEEAAILHAAIYLLAPKLDKNLDKSVYSYRLHKNWKKKAKRGQSLFREKKIEVPFLKSSTIRSIDPFAAWYELWPAFQEDAKKAYLTGQYTHLTKTDIFSFFEYIDLEQLHNLLRSYIKKEDEKVLQLILTILSGWTRLSNAGMPITRGIPQGNDVSSFLGNIFLIPLDRALKKFCNQCDGCWFRYVDDVKVYTRSAEDARAAVFEINNVLRDMHLSLQGNKTEILSGAGLEKEHDDTKIENVEKVFDKISKLSTKNKEITKELKKVSSYLSAFTTRLPESVRGIKGKENRLFRRLLATYGMAHRTRKGLNDLVYTAISELPDRQVLRSCLAYLGKQELRNHDEIIERLLMLLKNGKFLFPYQVALILEAMIQFHPDNPKSVSSRVREYALGSNLGKKSDWLVLQKALELIATFPYHERYISKICIHYSKHSHPMVRRAAVMLLPRSPKKEVRMHLVKFSCHPDTGVSCLAQYLLQLCTDTEFASQEIKRLRKSNHADNFLIKGVYKMYAISTTESSEIAKEVLTILSILNKSRSKKIHWHKERIRERISWAV